MIPAVSEHIRWFYRQQEPFDNGSDERRASAALYPTSGRRVVGLQNSAREVEASGRPTQGSDPMSASSVSPELARRRMLIASLDEPTLRALVSHGDQDDASMARAELMLREGNLFGAGNPAATQATVRVCRHCGIGAPEAVAMNEPWCPGRGQHSYVDTPVSQPLPDLLETGEGR